MAPSRKSGGRSGMTVTLTVSPEKLRDILEPVPTKEESPVKETKESEESPATSVTLQAAPASNGDNASDSNPATPAAGTPAPPVMGPPTEGVKKKGIKRSAAAANGLGPDGLPKVRGKPGPKKKPRLEDGSIDPNANAKLNGAGAAHKLGPKANQGAINAGLRALDRSGKPCRKWAKGGFRLKSFTGVVWEIERWTAPPKISQESTEDSADASAESSSKENKENSQAKSDANSHSNSAADVDTQSNTQSVAASSPAPMAVAAAS